MGRRHELPALVVLGVRRQDALAHRADDTSTVDNSRRVVDGRTVRHGQPHDGDARQICRAGGEVVQCGTRGTEQVVPEEQVAARVSRQRQLREGDRRHAVRRSLADHPFHLLRVPRRIP